MRFNFLGEITMNERRKRVEEYIYSSMDKLDPSGKNKAIYKEKFAKMSDADFHRYMENLRDGNDRLAMYTANIVDKVDLDTLIKTAKDFGIELFERIRMWDKATGKYYLTPKKYIILQLAIRRMSQFIDHKLSVPEGDNHIDMLTGQVVKPDRAGAISQVEIQALYARNFRNTILELIKYRGGDVNAFAEYKRELEEQGRTSVGKDTGSIVRSAVVLDVLYSGIHIESNASGV